MALFNMILHRWVTMRKHGSKAEVLLPQGRNRNKVMKEYIRNHYLGGVLICKISLCPDNYT